MYKEIYEGIVDLFTRRPTDEQDDRNSNVATYLTNRFGFDGPKIKRILRIEPEGANVGLIFVLAPTPEDKMFGSYCDYVMFDGKMYNIVLFNANIINAQHENQTILQGIINPIFDICINIMDRTLVSIGIDTESPISQFGVIGVTCYAPVVLTVAVLQHLARECDWAVGADTVWEVVTNRYKDISIGAVESWTEYFRTTSNISSIIDLLLDDSGINWLEDTEDLPCLKFLNVDVEELDDFVDDVEEVPVDVDTVMEEVVVEGPGIVADRLMEEIVTGDTDAVADTVQEEVADNGETVVVEANANTFEPDSAPE